MHNQNFRIIPIMYSSVPVNAENTISVVIATYKRPLLLKRCVEQIHHQLDASDEIVIANDDPTSRAFLHRFWIVTFRKPKCK